MTKLEGPGSFHTDDEKPMGTAAASPEAAQAASAPSPPRVDHGAIIYAAVLASIFAALSPSLFFSFGYHNDFNAWAYDTHICCTRHPETQLLVSIGRYFGAYAQNLQFWTIHSLADLWIWRLIGIISTAMLALYYLYVVSLRRPPTWQNACLTVAIFSLPTMQFQAIWVSMYMFWTPPILLSLVAAELLLKAAEGDFVSNRYARQRAARLTLQAFAALLAGFFFYPMSATFVLVPAAHLLLTENRRQVRRMAVLAVAIVGGAFIAVFLIHKFIVLPRLAHLPDVGDYQFKFADHALTEAMRRLWIYLTESSSLWLGLQIPLFRYLVGLLALFGAGYCAVRIFRRAITTREFVNVLMACSLFVVAVAPLLIVHQFSTTYRIMLTMTGIELLILFWLLNQMPIGALRLASIFAVLGITCSLIGIYGTSASAQAEYDVYSKAVANLSPQQFHSLVILRPARARPAFGFALENDYGGLPPISNAFDLLIGARYKGAAAFDVATLQMPPDYGLAMERNDKNLPLGIPKTAVVIDTSPVYGLPDFKDAISQMAIVSARPRGENEPVNAVDGSTNTFWQVCANQPFPIELALMFPAEHTLRAYSLSTVDETDRMPSSWEIWVSSDQTNWRRLQEITDAKPWEKREERRYDVEPQLDTTAVKLVVNATRMKSCMRLYEFRPIF
jgi:hypothetical protein